MTWQPDGWNDDMSEAPKDGTPLDLWVDGERVPNAAWKEATHNGFGDPISDAPTWVYWDCDVTGTWHLTEVRPQPTYWRYLPSPPSKQED